MPLVPWRSRGDLLDLHQPAGCVVEACIHDFSARK
jgi:hypothetical protein